MYRVNKDNYLKKHSCCCLDPIGLLSEAVHPISTLNDQPHHNTKIMIMDHPCNDASSYYYYYYYYYYY